MARSDQPLEEPPGPSPTGQQSPWQQNHGSFLVVVALVILGIGAISLVVHQSRFTPPRFPGPSAIEQPPDESESLAPAMSKAPDDSVMIRVTGAANSFGAVMIGIYDSQEQMSAAPTEGRRMAVPIREGVAAWTIAINDLAERFAISAYHDENGDGILNRNNTGVAAERYAYSRDARSRGPTEIPSFEDVSIERPDGGTTIELFVR